MRKAHIQSVFFIFVISICVWSCIRRPCSPPLIFNMRFDGANLFLYERGSEQNTKEDSRIIQNKGRFALWLKPTYQRIRIGRNSPSPRFKDIGFSSAYAFSPRECIPDRLFSPDPIANIRIWKLNLANTTQQADVSNYFHIQTYPHSGDTVRSLLPIATFFNTIEPYKPDNEGYYRNIEERSSFRLYAVDTSILNDTLLLKAEIILTSGLVFSSNSRQVVFR